MLYFVVGSKAMAQLCQEAGVRLQKAFRPKTHKCYLLLFRTFLAFVIHMKVKLAKVDCSVILSFLELLTKHNTSTHMVANYVAAIKAKFMVFGLQYWVLDDPRVKYFLRSLKVNRPLCVPRRNIMDIPTLRKLILLCDDIPMGSVFKALFLTAFFGFLRLSNLTHHSAATFDPSRHITPGDVFFAKKFVKILIKWSKTIQTRDKCHILSLPRLKSSILCPHRALKELFQMYAPSENEPLFQVMTPGGWRLLIDSRVRKTLAKLNSKLGYPPGYFTFHTFRRSGATLAYNSDIPVQKIKHHGSWTSECVWRYIQQDQTMGEHVASAFATVLADA